MVAYFWGKSGIEGKKMTDTLICMTCGKTKEEGLHAGSHSGAMQHAFVGIKPNGNSTLIQACDRLLQTEREIKEMPKEQRDWFFGKAGHSDCFMVAKALKDLLQRSTRAPVTQGEIPSATLIRAMRAKKDPGQDRSSAWNVAIERCIELVECHFRSEIPGKKRNKTLAILIREFAELPERLESDDNAIAFLEQDDPGHLRVLRTISAEIDEAQPARESGWLPIETAPQTTREILVYCPGNKCIYTVSYVHGDPEEKSDESGWYHFGGSHIELTQEPSHWMPVPDTTCIEGQ